MNSRLRLTAWQFDVIMHENDARDADPGSRGGSSRGPSRGVPMRSSPPTRLMHVLRKLLRRVRRNEAAARSQPRASARRAWVKASWIDESPVIRS
jgi:hypothetical protein